MSEAAISPRRRIEFFSKRVAEDGDCWRWTGAINRSTKGGGLYGRAMLYVDGKPVETWYAHRLSWHIHCDDIPDGLHIDHLCRNTLCVNPAHLEPVPNEVNAARAAAVLRAARPLCSKGHDDWGERPSPNGRYCKTCNRIRVKKNKQRKSV